MDTHDGKARVMIVDPATGEVIAECRGAGDLGTCPQAAPGMPVPCAGCRLVPVENTGLEGWTLTVAADNVDACPLAFVPVRDAQNVA